VFSTGEIPVPVREKPSQQESSLGPVEVTTWVKRRQSDTQAVTKVKRLSSVKNNDSRADSVHFLEGNSR